MPASKPLIFIGSDHAGFQLKGALIAFLKEEGYEVTDHGTHSPESCDYPFPAQAVCKSVLASPGSFGILICGSGIGMSIAANRFKGIRAALCTSEFQARSSRSHNNANVLCLAERITAAPLALEFAGIFLNGSFEGGRHERRIEAIEEFQDSK